MAIIRPKTNEIHCKIVFYGPGRGGKTTNLIMIHKAVGKRSRGELISIETAGDRTIFFDFLPMDLGVIRRFNIKISVYTVPGQVRYNDTRKLVLKGVDGVVFIADSLQARKQQNVESFLNLQRNLVEIGSSISSVACVLQYNKRDLNGPDALVMPVQEMEWDLNRESLWPWFEASAIRGDGVKDTFKKICMMTVADVSKQLLKG
jgi:signal recognition particle receptor subunit beta